MTAPQPNPSLTDPMLDLALSYAARGWPVFPCRAADDYDHDTSEVLPEKAPLVSNGFRGATLNERVIRELWKRNPGALVGVPTGERSGFWVLDVDVPPKHEDGRPWLEHQQRLHGAITTKQAETGSGGLHFLFTHEHGIRNADVATGVETRGEGGYFIAPGSVMEDGRTYRWLNEGPIQRAPQWLLDLLIKPKHTSTPAPHRTLENAGASEIEEMLSYVSPDCSYQEWVSVLMAVHSALGEAGLAVADAWSAQGRKYRQGEVTKKWRGFTSEGGVNLGSLAELARQGGADLSEISRRHRPLPDNDNTRLVDIKKMLERAREKVARTQESIAEPIAGGDQESVPTPLPPAQQTAPEEDDSPFRFTPFSWKDPKSLPRREFAFGKHYIRKYVSVTVAPGGLGKTSNSVVEALSMASGKELTGDKPPRRLRVWLFNAEDPRDEMDRRIMAACLHYGLSPADIEGHLFLDTGREQELIVMHEDKKTGVTINAPIVEAVAAQIRKYGIDVLIVDPFVSTHRVNENDNGAIDKVAKLWAQIADDTNCAIDVVHHLRKLADREATVEDARGAISLIGAARSVRVLNRMSIDDANAAGIDEKDRYSYFHIHYGKQNLTRMDTTQHWRKMESVGLGNGGKGLLAATKQDTAGVVTEWKWPTSEEIADGITDEQKSNIKSVLAGARHKSAPQGKPWAGEAVAYVLDEDLTDKAAKKRVGAILKALLKEGFLEVYEDKDPVSRTITKYVK